MMPNREAQTAHNEERLAAEGITKLEAGATAPAISAPSTAGSFELSSALEDGKFVVLFVFPAVNTPNSTRELMSYSKDLAEYSSNEISFYGITGASLEELEVYRDKYGIGLEMIADPDLTIAQAYGCALEDGKYPQRTMIGINPDGTIAFYKRYQLQKAQILEGFGLK